MTPERMTQMKYLLAFLVFATLIGCSARGRSNMARMSECPDSPNCVSSQSKDGSHFIEPLVFKGDPEKALVKLEKVILSMKRSEIAIKEPGYIRAVFTSAVFRFKDDVECMIDEAKGVINIRSASRLGYSDFGVNRARVEEIRKLFIQEEK